MKSKGGRHEGIKATPEEVQRACDILARGGTIAQAEEELGRANGTIRGWMTRGKEHAEAGKKTTAAAFFRNATRARAAGKKLLQDMVWKASTEGFEVTITEVVKKGNDETLTRVKKTTFIKPELALEILARRWPKEWGRTDRVEVDDMPKEDPRDKDPEEREHLLRILSEKYSPRRKSHLDGITRNLPKPPGRTGDVGANGSGNGAAS